MVEGWLELAGSVRALGHGHHAALELSDIKPLAQKSQNWGARKNYNFFKEKNIGAVGWKRPQETIQSFLLPQGGVISTCTVGCSSKLLLEAWLSDGARSLASPSYLLRCFTIFKLFLISSLALPRQFLNP